MLPLLNILVIGATVGVRVTVVGDLGSDQEAMFVDELVAGLVEEGRRAIVDRGELPCNDPASCVAAFRKERGAEEVVLIEVFAGASSVRFDSGRALPGDREPSLHAEQVLARDARSLRGVARTLVRSLYPKSATAPPSLVTMSPPPIDAALPIGPFVVFGASAALTVAAIVVGANSQAHFERVETEPLSPDDNRTIYDQAHTEATVATVLFSAAAAGVIAGVVWLAAD